MHETLADVSISTTTQPGATRRRVLITDDNEDFATSLALLLEVLGHDVRTAHDGLQAIAIASEFHPDVVFLDLGLPQLDGYEICRRMRAQPWARGVLIVALTGWGQRQDRLKARAAGFDDHLVKPVECSTLERLVDQTPSPVESPSGRVP